MQNINGTDLWVATRIKRLTCASSPPTRICSQPSPKSVSVRTCYIGLTVACGVFRELANREFSKQVKGFDSEARKRIFVHTWVGNVRELKGTIRSAVLFTNGDWVTADKLEFEDNPLPGEVSLSLKNEEMEKKQIIRALEQTNGNRSLAAELLGIGRTTLYNKMQEYGIKYKE